MNRIIRGDILSFCRHYRGEKFHALLCDPPYHLISDTRNGSQRVAGTGPYGRHTIETKGFMGKAWDGGDVAYRPETWAALAEHLYPGAFGMAFASSRGWHRLAVAIEDAGLRIHPSIFGWVFGSGFPKATRVKDAPEFDGHRYGLQAMKPALEPIIVFQKPYEGKPVESIVKTGAGALNIDGGRIGYQSEEDESEAKTKNQHEDFGSGPMTNEIFGEFSKDRDNYDPPGRWPANFYVDEEAAARLGEQSGETSKTGDRSTRSKTAQVSGTTFGPDNHESREYPNQSGTAARFFFNVNQQIDESDPVLYCAKASRKERDAGLEGMEEQIVARSNQAQAEAKRGKTIARRNTSTGMNAATRVRNAHPTVKPIDLTRWLATLLLPPAEYAPRRILVPFSGSGSEMIGAMLAGWEMVVGIEMDLEYVRIARARLEHWGKAPKQLGFDLS